MAERFNPAPQDKHASDPKTGMTAASEAHQTLDDGLRDTFPASDPVSTIQPVQSRHNAAPPPKPTDYQNPQRRLGIAITGAIVAVLVVIWWVR